MTRPDIYKKVSQSFKFGSAKVTLFASGEKNGEGGRGEGVGTKEIVATYDEIGDGRADGRDYVGAARGP